MSTFQLLLKSVQYVLRATVESILKRTLPHAMESMTGKALKDYKIVRSFPDMDKAYSQLKTLRFNILFICKNLETTVWNTENGYKDMKIVKYKSLGAFKIVTARGLHVTLRITSHVLVLLLENLTYYGSTGQAMPDAESKCRESEQGRESKSFSLVFPESWKQENLCANVLRTILKRFINLDDSLADKMFPGCTIKHFKAVTLFISLIENIVLCCFLFFCFQMVEVEIPQSLFEEQVRQFYGARLLEIQPKCVGCKVQSVISLGPLPVQNRYFGSGYTMGFGYSIKRPSLVGDIFKRESLEFSTDELVKEVDNSITEFRKHKQEYDGEHVKDQVQDILEGAKVLEKNELKFNTLLVESLISIDYVYVLFYEHFFVLELYWIHRI
ncbi:BnaA10g09460D [Brassica napus]|uniref:BnaA10g09460D protein n=1 Tax=Brassica napus TaxID=3708 RepID=A0A078FX49_BRANA|nr:BnaA10g09460D [Brassica napus]